ncbi:MAG TPA: lantibiotic dehydratase [Candidatus Polarisedimenticolia bacterium]|nr:lantibiotic dehydratase [Candidatus Polarisedimenticolia bacterium]
MDGPETDPPEPDPLVLLRVAAFPFESLEPLRARASLEPLGELLRGEEECEVEAEALGAALHRAAGPPVSGDPERHRRRLAIVALRRDLHNRRLDSARLDAAGPALGAGLKDRLGDHLERVRRLRSLEAGFQDAFRADLRAGRKALLGLAGTERFREGIRLAGRALFRAGATLESVDPDRWERGQRHVASKLAAYAARGAAKTSPNSVFCSTALARVTGGPAQVAGRNDPVRVDILLNVFEARKVTSCLGAEPAVRPAARLRPNPTLREADGAWTFWRPAHLRRLTDDEALSRVRNLPVVMMFLEEAASSRSAVEVLRAVEERSGAGAAEVARFLEDLVAAGLFSWEVELPYNCRRPLQALARICRDAGCDTPWLPEAEEIERQVEALPGLTSGERIERLDGIERRLQSLPHVRALKEDELFRLDAASGLEVALPRSILGEVREAVDRYARLFASLYPESVLRAGDVQRFLAAHPPDRDVPLLDLYHGVFEPETLLRPAAFPGPADVPRQPAGDTTATAQRFRRARDAFARLARRAEAEGRDEVLLTDADWRDILEDAPAPPWFCGALFQVDAAGPEAVAGGRARIVLNALFTGSGLASARLDRLHGDGKDASESPIAREVKRGWDRLERPGAILAEVTYMHWGRTANAGLRPSLFSYEIELPGETAGAGAQVIPLRELAVRYDSGEQRFVLRWLPRGLEVIPVIGSGISPEGFVSFLVSLGQQGFQPLTYFPGFEVDGIVAWPRFTWGRTVLFRRRWLLPAGSLRPELLDPAASDAATFAALTRLRRRHRIPRHVFVHTSAEPKPFYADLESPILADLVRRAASARADRPGPALTFTEMLPSPEGLWVADGAGRYASEFLVQLHGGRSGRPVGDAARIGRP